MTETDRRMARAAARLDDAAQASVAARHAEEEAADAPVGGDEQRRMRSASRVLRAVADHRITQAGRLAGRGC